MYKFLEKEHLHTLDGVALTGTTTCLDVLGKNLTWWAAELAAVACLEKGEKIPTIRKEYLEACASDDKKKAIDALQKKYPAFKKARFAHFDDKNTKADKGTDMHEELETYVKSCIRTTKGVPPEIYVSDSSKVSAFHVWAYNNVKRFLGSEVHCFHDVLFIGGICDCVAELKDGSLAIIDFKSSKEAFFNQFVQCALYVLQIERHGMFDSDGKQIDFPVEALKPFSQFIVFPFGAKELKPVVNKNIESLKRAAQSCVSLYREKSAFEN